MEILKATKLQRGLFQIMKSEKLYLIKNKGHEMFLIPNTRQGLIDFVVYQNKEKMAEQSKAKYYFSEYDREPQKEPQKINPPEQNIALLPQTIAPLPNGKRCRSRDEVDKLRAEGKEVDYVTYDPLPTTNPGLEQKNLS